MIIAIILIPVAYMIGWAVGIKKGVRYKVDQWVNAELDKEKSDIESFIHQQHNNNGSEN